MTTSENFVTKQTLFISIAISLVIGFLGGMVYTVYKAPGGQTPQPAVQQQTLETDQEPARIIATLEEETRNHPDNGEAWVRLGHSYFDTNQYAKAIKAYTKALAIIPGNADVLTDLGVMYRRNGEPKKAIESFDKALQINPRHQQATFNKGVVYLYDLKDRANALLAWRTLLQINPAATAPDGTPISELVNRLEQRSEASGKQ